jgi:hypothetical protein
MKKTLSIIGVSLVSSFLVLQVFLPGIALGDDKIANPLNVDSIQSLISTGLTFVVNLLAIAGVLYILWTGFLLVKAQGNEKELETAKKSFTHAIIGMAIILGAWGIAMVISNTVSKITNNKVGLTAQTPSK